MENEITGLPGFTIEDKGPVSRAFLERKISSFQQAAHTIKHIPYGRNANKQDLLTVLTDNCGTCSTKHALLKQLADENGHHDIRLILGLIKMSPVTMPEVANTLKQHQLAYIPEAHNYLKYNGRRFDLMKSSADASAFENEILEEKEITPEQVTEFKVSYHKAYLKNWLVEHPQNGLQLEELWTIREQCIKDLYT